MRHVISIRSIVALTLLAWATAATVALGSYSLGLLIDRVRGTR